MRDRDGFRRTRTVLKIRFRPESPWCVYISAAQACYSFGSCTGLLPLLHRGQARHTTRHGGVDASRIWSKWHDCMAHA